MAARHVVVDGSNLATEGRSMPSLAQLDQAVREFLLENPEDMVTVVVDASFGHRIDPTESQMYEEAEAEGELVSPPAGAIGRGDAFLLRIADKTGATVLSNDSFQEFHGDYEWLFERGRLIGGKPVPGVGWIFTPRTPVRGPRSREAVKEAKRKTKGEPQSAMPGLDLAAERAKTTKGKGRGKVERAIAAALEEVVAPKDKPRRSRKGGVPPAEPVNDPLTFITFIAAHPLGGEVTATVDAFASHGAFVQCEGALCYVPLSAMGDPPPKSAREVLSKGEPAVFVVQALDPQRRGVELAVPGFAKIAGAPTEETVAAEIEAQAEPEEGGPTPVPVKRARKKRATPTMVAEPAMEPEPVEAELPAAVVPVPVPVPAGRRRAPAKKAEAVALPAAEPAPAAVVRSGRRRGPAKKAPGTLVGAEPAVEAEPEPESVVPSGGRRAPAKKAAPARAESAELAQPPQKAPARKRVPRPAPPAQPELEVAPAPSAEAPPARTRRRPGPRPAEVAPVDPASPTPHEPAAPDAPRSRRRRAATPAPVLAPPAAPAAPPAPPVAPIAPVAPVAPAPPASRVRPASRVPRVPPVAPVAPVEQPPLSPPARPRRRGAAALPPADLAIPTAAPAPDSGDGSRPRRNPTRVASEAAAAEKKATSVSRRRPRATQKIEGAPSAAAPEPPAPESLPPPTKAARGRRARTPVEAETPPPVPQVAPASEAPRRRRSSGRKAAGSDESAAP